MTKTTPSTSKATKQTRVILSFHQSSQNEAKYIKAALNDAKIKVSLDPWDDGGDLPTTCALNTSIFTQLNLKASASVQQTVFLLPILSPLEHAPCWIDDNWQHTIYDQATALNIKVMPMLCHLDSSAIPAFLNHLSCATLGDMTDKQNISRYQRELWRLINTIRECSGSQTIELPQVTGYNQRVGLDETSVTLEIHRSLLALFETDNNTEQSLSETFLMMQDGLFFELGVRFPLVQTVAVDDLSEDSLRVLINGIPETQVQLSPDQNPQDHLVRVISHVLRRKSSSFITTEQTREMLQQLAPTFSQLISEATQPTLSLFTLTDILRRLVAEGISIRNLPRVLGEIIRWSPIEPSPLFLSEYVRSGLKREITHRFTRGQNTLVVVLLHPELEQLIHQASHYNNHGCYVDLPKHQIHTLQTRLKEVLQFLPENSQQPVILTIIEIRPSVKRLIATAIPMLEVLSYQDINADITIQPLVRIALEEVVQRTDLRNEQPKNSNSSKTPH